MLSRPLEPIAKIPNERLYEFGKAEEDWGRIDGTGFVKIDTSYPYPITLITPRTDVFKGEIAEIRAGNFFVTIWVFSLNDELIREYLHDIATGNAELALYDEATEITGKGYKRARVDAGDFQFPQYVLDSLGL